MNTMSTIRSPRRLKKSIFALSILTLSIDILAVPATQIDFSLGEKLPIIQTHLIDMVDANYIKTEPGETRELIFDNGSVVAVGLDTEIIVRVKDNKLDKVELLRGSLRLTSGSTESISVTGLACSGTIHAQVKNASGIFESGLAGGFKAAMVYGDKIEISGNNKTVALVKPGFSAHFAQDSNHSNSAKPTSTNPNSNKPNSNCKMQRPQAFVSPGNRSVIAANQNRCVFIGST